MESGVEPSGKVRSFIAIHPGKETSASLVKLVEALRSEITSDRFRWSRPEQLHLTLQFLGYVERPRLADYETVLRYICDQIGPFRLSAEGLGCFPAAKRPRVLWVGLRGDISALQGVKKRLDVAFEPLGYVSEKRDFHPHITVARINEPKRVDIERLRQAIVSYGAKTFGEWRVEKLDLMQSILSPKGATYRVLESFVLDEV